MGVMGGRPFELPERIGSGERNDTLFRYGRSLRAKGASDEDVERELLRVNAERCSPALADYEVISAARSACSKPAGRSPEFQHALDSLRVEAGVPDSERIAFNDKELSRLFARMYRNRLRYVPEVKSWYAYDGTRWADEAAGGELYAQTLMKEFSDRLGIAAATIEDEKERADATKGAARYFQQNARDRLLKDCKSELVSHISEFDTNRMLFNCRNVTLDLNTMKAHPHTPDDMLTKVAGCDYDEDAEPVEWAAFLMDTLRDDEVVRFLQAIVGKALAADTTDERFTIAYGPTRTGKSTTIDTILAMFGDYGATAQAETFQEIKRNSRAASGDVARLADVRFLECPEPPKGMMLDVALIKQMTGGDLITARKLNQGEFQFRPVFHLVMNTNYLPEVRDQTLFESGRVVVVPFLNRRAEGERDTTLKERMRAPEYLSAVLNWALQGLDLQREFGEKIPEACRRITAKYSTDSNRIGAFVADECETGEDKRGDGARLYERYAAWAEDQGYARLSKRNLFQELERIDGVRNIGKSTVDGRTSRNVFIGIRPKDAVCPQ